MHSEEQLLREHLGEAERHVAQGERLVEHQRMTIEARRRDGLDIELPTQLLAEMEESQRLHIEGRNRLREELAGDVAPLVFKKQPAAGANRTPPI
jgi:hypothetical protein